jgi:hypothetical protein
MANTTATLAHDRAERGVYAAETVEMERGEKVPTGSDAAQFCSLKAALRVSKVSL